MSIDLYMLWPPHRKLMLHGAEGQAVVVKSETDRGGTSSGRGLFGWKVTIRVKFPDGDARDFDDYICSDDTGTFSVDPGDTVPVRLDPNKHRARIDDRALRAARDARHAQRDADDAAAVRRTEERLGIPEARPPA
jgi:hypothetical protein